MEATGTAQCQAHLKLAGTGLCCCGGSSHRTHQIPGPGEEKQYLKKGPAAI